MIKLSRRRVAIGIADTLVAGGSARQVMAELAAYLVASRLTNQASLYIADIEQLLAERGYVVVDVISAHSLDDQLRNQIKSLVGVGAKTVLLREQVDAQLIGGVIISSRGQQLDTSVRTHLDKLRNMQG